jgi:hypothetical protein
VSSSVAQLEELRAECDKELNNARLMGDHSPLPFILQAIIFFLRVIVMRSGMEALAKSGVKRSSFAVINFVCASFHESIIRLRHAIQGLCTLSLKS